MSRSEASKYEGCCKSVLILHYCLILQVFWPLGGQSGLTINLFACFCFYNSCSCVFTRSVSHSLPQLTVYRRVKSISAVISVMSHSVCVCVSCGAASKAPLSAVRQPFSAVSCCLFSFFPYFHTCYYSLSFSLFVSVTVSLSPPRLIKCPHSHKMTELLHKHLCKQIMNKASSTGVV